MALTVFTVYFLTLAVLLVADIIETGAGLMAVLVLCGIGAAVIVAAGRLNDR